MSTDYRKGPNYVHPETPSAVGSRNSLNRDTRDEYSEGRLIIDEEVDKLLNHIHHRLPPEVLEDVVVQGNIKSYLHTYYNQTLQNMVNRYLTSTEDEMGKKVRDLIDKDENKMLNRYTPREISDMLNHIGGVELFNTGDMEKSTVNIMGHLHGHSQRGVAEFESTSNSLLMQQVDIGEFIGGENAYAIVKATFRDNYLRPEEVVDIKVAINVLDKEMISPVISHQLAGDKLVKEVISKHISTLIDGQLDEINKQLKAANRQALSKSEGVFEKIKRLDDFIDDEVPEDSPYNDFIPGDLLDRLEGMTGEVKSMDVDGGLLGVQKNIMSSLDREHIRTRGWNTAVNSITSILDESRMGYQHIENQKLARRLVIREYEDSDVNMLPDERYQIEMRYVSSGQIREQKAAYTAQLYEFQREIHRLWDVVELVYKEEKDNHNHRDWDDVVSETVGRKKARKFSWFGGSEVPERKKLWNEVTNVQRELTSLEEMNRTYEELTIEFTQRFRLMRTRLKEIFSTRMPAHRELLENRINFLESEFVSFMNLINPYHVQPGLLLELSMTSIKRRKVTIKSLTRVLGVFLQGISKGFNPPVEFFAHKRRSNVADPEMSDFGSLQTMAENSE